MKSIFKIIDQNKLYYLLNLFVILLAITILCLFSRAEGFIWLNQFHSKILNSVFENITFFGDGWFIIITALVILMFLKKHRNLAFIILLSYISSGIFAQIIKHLFVSPRPSVYFELHHYQYYLDTFATSRIGFASFPSGHTASFFAFATVLSGYCKRRYICILLLFMSALVGYSRIYLAHHFLIDVCVGAIIGILFGILSTVWFDQLISNPMIKNKLQSIRFSNKKNINPSLN